MSFFKKPIVGKVTDPMDDEKHPIQPTPEGYVGHNNPYRGTQPHGVPHGDDVILPDELEEVETPVVHPAKPLDLPDPIPVRIVTEYRRERRHWRPSTFTIGTTPVQIHARNDNRRRLIIKNCASGGTTLRAGIAGLQYQDGMNCYILGDGAREEIYSTEPVVVVSDGADILVCTIEEYVIDESD